MPQPTSVIGAGLCEGEESILCVFVVKIEMNVTCKTKLNQSKMAFSPTGATFLVTDTERHFVFIRPSIHADGGRVCPCVWTSRGMLGNAVSTAKDRRGQTDVSLNKTSGNKKMFCF